MQTLHIPAGELVDAFARCKHSISSEETRYYLGGAHIRPAKGGAFIQTTDGHRLTRVKIAGEFPAFESFIVSRQSIADVQKNVKRRHHHHIATIALGAENKICMPGLDDIPLQLIDGTFPDCDRVIPDLGDMKTAMVDRAEFMKAVAAVHGFAKGAGHDMIKLVFADNELTLSASAVGGAAQMKIECGCAEFEGELAIGFNGQYLAEYAKRLESDKINIHVRDSGSPTRFSGVGHRDEHETFVLMPMRL